MSTPDGTRAEQVKEVRFAAGPSNPASRQENPVAAQRSGDNLFSSQLNKPPSMIDLANIDELDTSTTPQSRFQQRKSSTPTWSEGERPDRDAAFRAKHAELFGKSWTSKIKDKVKDKVSGWRKSDENAASSPCDEKK